MRNSIMVFIFFLLLSTNTFFWKTNYQSYYKILFKLFNLIMSGFCFSKFVKTLEKALVLQSFLFINKIE